MNQKRIETEEITPDCTVYDILQLTKKYKIYYYRSSLERDHELQKVYRVILHDTIHKRPYSGWDPEWYKAFNKALNDLLNARAGSTPRLQLIG